MLRVFFFILFFWIIFLDIFPSIAEKNQGKNKSINTNKLEWGSDNSYFDNQLLWYEVDESEIKKVRMSQILNERNNNSLYIRSMGKGVSVNGFFYPDISNYVPNAFVEDPNKLFGLNSRLISKTRFCNGNNFSENCIDGVMDFDFKLFNNDEISIYPKITLQSLTNRGSTFGEGLSLGVKVAKELSPNWSLAFGGENIVHFDETIDLGRNFFVVASTYLPFNNSSKYSTILFLNAGIGSDFYGYRGNGFLFRTTCLGRNTLTGIEENPNSCTWGPIASAALSLNDRISIISEWFGYSYGAGFSIRPFKEQSLSFSLFATDFINGFPKYAKDHCTKGVCETRFYGSININF